LNINLVAASPYWHLTFEKEKARILHQCRIKQFPVIIEHIGSTAVPDLAAKPTIDILIGVPVGVLLDESIPILQKCKYIYVSKYNEELPDRRFFIKIKPYLQLDKKRRKEISKADDMPLRSIFDRLFHVHLVHDNSQFFKKHLAFRDHLRKNKEDRLAYQALKVHLANQNWSSEADYARAKAPFIQTIMNKLGFHN